MVLRSYKNIYIFALLSITASLVFGDSLREKVCSDPNHSGYDKDLCQDSSMAMKKSRRFIQAPGKGEEACFIDTETNLMIPKSAQLAGLNGQTWADAKADPAGQNAANLCGHNDWRLPTILELAGKDSYSHIGERGTSIITGWDIKGACKGTRCRSPGEWMEIQGFGDFGVDSYDWEMMWAWEERRRERPGYLPAPPEPPGNYWSSTEKGYTRVWAGCLTDNCDHGPGSIIGLDTRMERAQVLPVRPN
jgi:hypothetical protein